MFRGSGSDQIEVPGEGPALKRRDGDAFAAAIALYNSLSLMIPIRLKWPNDLLCNTRKVGGILIEQRENRIALGIGVNVNHDVEDFPTSLRHKAGSLRIASGETKDLQALFYTVIMHLDAAVQRLRSGQLLAVHEEWVKACDLIGKEISIMSAKRTKCIGSK